MKNKDIAIISMACRLPDADNIQEFWNNLKNGQSSIIEIPSDRWSLDDFYYKDSSQSVSKYGCFLKDIKSFDPDFFNLNRNDIKITDPQQRILIELAYETIISSKYTLESIKGKKVGVFAGVTKSDYQELLQESLNAGKIRQNTLVIGILRNLIASRISNIFDLQGPSLTIDTACSSSLVAIQTAIESILNKTSDLALVGGINLNITPTPYYGMSMAGALTRKDKYSVFDSKSDGFIMGEGGGFVLLKPLENALKDEDTILGVIKGFAVNNDGKSISPMAPRPVTQQNVVYEAYINSGIDPEIVDYVEAHGTGTALGDAIEANTIIKNFKKSYIGSVKPNIGHLLSGSGIASLIKSLLIIQNRIVPPLINYSLPRKDLKLEQNGFILNKEPVVLEDNKLITIGINSFGFGGTNAHVILQEYKSDKNDITSFKQIIPSYNKQEYWIEPVKKESVKDLEMKNYLPKFYIQNFIEKESYNDSLEDLNTNSNIYICSDYINHELSLGLIRKIKSLGIKSRLLFDINDIEESFENTLIFLKPDYKTLLDYLQKISNKSILKIIIITENSIISNKTDITDNTDNFITSGLIFSYLSEYENINDRFKIKQIDFEKNDFKNINDIIENTLYEIKNNDSESLIVYRNNQRFINNIKEIEITENRSSKVIKNGIYLVTGVSGIMSEIIKKLSEYSVNLVVCSRRNKDEIKGWSELEKLVISNKSNIDFIKIDISKKEDVINLFEKISKKYKRVNGIIHGAGIAIPSSFKSKTLAEFEKVLSPKVKGLILIKEALEKYNFNPDFIISFSSLSSSISGLNKGISDYSTANFFMDQYSRFMRNTNKNFKVINWGPWEEKGMASNTYTLKKLSEKGIYPISLKNALECFDIILNSGIDEVIVSNSLNKKILNSKSVIRLNTNNANISQNKNSNLLKETPKELNIKASDKNITDNEQKTQKFLLELVSSEIDVDIKRIDIDTNLLDLGIDSLSAIDMAKKIQDLGFKDIPFELFFEYQTIRAISGFLLKKNNLKDLESTNSQYNNLIKDNEEIPKDFNLSRIQKSFYKSYLISDSLSFSFQRQVVIGNINKKNLEKSVHLILKKHDQLRSNFFIDKNNENFELIEKISDYDKYQGLNIIDELSSESSNIEIIENNFVNQKFNLETDLLFKIGLVENNNELHILMLFHHIIFDGISMKVFTEELWTNYEKLCNNYVTYQEEYLDTSYFDYIKYIDNITYKDDLIYWDYLIKEKYKFFKGNNKLFNQYIDLKSHISTSYYETINNKIASDIETFSKNNQIPLQTIYLKAYYQALSILYDIDNLIINIAISGREIPIPQISKVIGSFADTYPIFINSDLNFKEIREQLQNIKKYQKLGSDEIVKIFKTNNIEYSPFGFSFAVFNKDWADNIKSITFKESYMRGFNVNTKFSLTFWEDSRGLNYTINYPKGIISNEQINKFSKSFINSLENILYKDKENHFAFEDTSLTIRHKENINNIHNNRISHSIIKNFLTTPDKPCIVFKDQVITYESLNKKASSIAGALLKRGFNSYSNIAVISSTSVEYIITLIAIFRIGATCIPIEKSYPLERIKTMLQISRADLIIDTGYKEESDNSFINLFYSDLISENSSINFSIDINTEKTAYIIFTSGSTGKPKGVPISYKALENYLFWCIETFDYNKTDKCVQTSSISFDASLRQILAPIISGGTVYPIPKDILHEPKDLFRFIQKNDITIWSSIPSLWEIVVRLAETLEYKDLPNLRLIKTGGEVLNVDLVLRTQKIFKGVTIFNLYGPTETTINATYHIIDKNIDKNTEVIPIGKPSSNLVCNIFDENGFVIDQKYGEKGELFVSGVGLTSGYLMDLTEDSELINLNETNFFIDEYGTRFYKTGDLVSLNSNGEYIFHGRKDKQVKIRGHRVELEEIQNILLSHKDISNAYAIFEKDILTVFIETSIKKTDIFKDYLKTKVPEYLIPNKIKLLKKFPILENGKLNVKELKNLKTKVLTNEKLTKYTQTEENLISIWKDILKVENVNDRSNFFDLGGDSISLMQMFVEVEKSDLFIKLPKISEFYKNGELKHLAKLIDKLSKDVVITLDKNLVIDYTANRFKKFNLSPSQMGFYLKNKFSNESDSSWKAVFCIKGEIKPDIFQKTLNYLRRRHQMLSVKLVEEDKPYFQEINDSDNMPFKYENLNFSNEQGLNNLIKNLIAEMSHSKIDITQYPLVDIKLLKSDNLSLISIQSHHILADGLSFIILINELIYIYSQLSKSKDSFFPKLHSLENSFSDYIDYLNDNNYNLYEKYDSLSYWKNIFKKEYKPIKFNNNIQLKDSVIIDINKFNILKRISSKFRTTPFNLFLTLFYKVLSEFFNRKDLIIGIAHHGRDCSLKDINNIFGCFAKSIPIRVEYFNNFESQLNNISENVRESTSYNLNPIEIIRELELNKEFNKNNINLDSILGSQFFLSYIDMSLNNFYENTINIDWENSYSDFEPSNLNNNIFLTVKKTIESLSFNFIFKGLSEKEKDLFMSIFSTKLDFLLKYFEKSKISFTDEKINTNDYEKVESALIGYLPSKEILKKLNINEYIFKNLLFGDKKSVLLEIIQTNHGNTCLLCIPFFAEDIQLKNSEIIKQYIHEAIKYADSLGIKYLSLAGMLPAITDYGNYFKEIERPLITTGHTSTVAAVIKNSVNIIEKLNIDINDKTIAFIGLGSIGSATALNIFDYLQKPKKIFLCDIYGSEKKLNEIELDLIRRYGFDNIIEKANSKNNIPDEIYNSDIMICAVSANTNIIDINKLKPQTILVDDSFPHCFDIEKAITRMKKYKDIYVIGGGLLDIGEMQRFIYLPVNNDNLKEELSKNIIKNSIASCQLESLLMIKNTLNITRGLVNHNNVSEYIKIMDKLDIKASPLHLSHYTLD